MGTKFISKDLYKIVKEKPALLERVSQSPFTGKKKSELADENLQLLSNYINYDVARKLELKDINWTKIASKIGTKSKDDCKNKFYQSLFNTIFVKPEFSLEEDKDLIEQIQIQAPDKEEDIDFTDIENGKSEDTNKQRWCNLKKVVGSRSSMDIQTVLASVQGYLAKCKSEYLTS